MILVKPEEFVDLFFKSVHNTGEAKLIADDPEDGVEMYLYDDGGFPKVTVLVDGVLVDAVQISEVDDVVPIMREMYKDYIVGADTADDNLSRDEEIRFRQEELEDGIIDFLSIVLEENVTKAEAEFGPDIPEILDDVMELLYKKYNIDPYRPMVLEDDDGEEFYEEYPYACLEFDDD